MSIEMWLVLAILVTAVVLFVTEWVRVDAVALGVVLALMLTGVLTTNEALAGFSSTAVLTITFLFIVGGAVWQTGLADAIGQRILQVAGTSEIRLLVVLMVAVALLSGFMSNTGTVAVLLPAVVILAKRAKISPAKLLIPLSFGSMLGGAATLIGTPPNIIVNDALKAAGYEPFGFFTFSPIGLILIVIGIGFMLLIGRVLLPNHVIHDPHADEEDNPQELLRTYHLEEYLHRLHIPKTSPLVNKTIAESNLRHDFDVTALKIMRPPANGFALVDMGHNRDSRHPRSVPILPERDTQLKVNDDLVVEGNLHDVKWAAEYWQLEVHPSKPKDIKALLGKDVGIAEVVLPPRSKLIGKTLTSSRFGNTYNLKVLKISRPAEPQPLDPKETILRFGDILLVQGRWEDIQAMRNKKRDFVVVGEPETMAGAPHRDKAGMALLILLVMVGLMVWGGLPLVAVALMAALAMVLLGCLTAEEAYRSIEWRSLVLIAGMLPMSTALEKVGLVDAAAQGLVTTLGSMDVRLLIAGLFLLTALFTQVLSNTATTVVIAPVALAAAQTLGVAPQALLMAVAIAASMAFATPVASPTNTLVMGAGDYRFGDYLKVGVPLMLLMMLVTVIILPWFFPLS